MAAYSRPAPIGCWTVDVDTTSFSRPVPLGQWEVLEAAAATGRIMSSLAAAGGLAGRGGIAGHGGGLAS